MQWCIHLCLATSSHGQLRGDANEPVNERITTTPNWTPEAIQDRDDLYDCIEVDNPTAALAIDELFSEKADRLVDHPGLGQLGRIAGTRELTDSRSAEVAVPARRWSPVLTPIWDGLTSAGAHLSCHSHEMQQPLRAFSSYRYKKQLPFLQPPAAVDSWP